MAPLPLAAPHGEGALNKMLSSLSSAFKSKPRPSERAMEMGELPKPTKHVTFAPDLPRPDRKGKGKAPMLSGLGTPMPKEDDDAPKTIVRLPKLEKNGGPSKATVMFPNLEEYGGPSKATVMFPNLEEYGGPSKATVMLPKPEKDESPSGATVMLPKPEKSKDLRIDTVMFPPESGPSGTKSTWKNPGFSLMDYYDELLLNPWKDYRKRSLQDEESPAIGVTTTGMGASMQEEIVKCRLTMSQEMSLLVFTWVAGMFICGAIVWVMAKMERKMKRLMEGGVTGFGEKKGWLCALHCVGYGSMIIVIIAMFLMLMAVMFSLKDLLGEAIWGA
ncbi:hypothetical protein HOY80DRAFT_1134053 [Tuber brumale]|nr:hypothetical protein HOY80DRAFT_1134053 [Tuber brumale]